MKVDYISNYRGIKIFRVENVEGLTHVGSFEVENENSDYQLFFVDKKDDKYYALHPNTAPQSVFKFASEFKRGSESEKLFNEAFEINKKEVDMIFRNPLAQMSSFFGFYAKPFLEKYPEAIDVKNVIEATF